MSDASKNEEESLPSNLRKDTATKPDEKSYEYQDSLIILTDDTQDEIANLVTDNIDSLVYFPFLSKRSSRNIKKRNEELPHLRNQVSFPKKILYFSNHILILL